MRRPREVPQLSVDLHRVEQPGPPPALEFLLGEIRNLAAHGGLELVAIEREVEQDPAHALALEGDRAAGVTGSFCSIDQLARLPESPGIDQFGDLPQACIVRCGRCPGVDRERQRGAGKTREQTRTARTGQVDAGIPGLAIATAPGHLRGSPRPSCGRRLCNMAVRHRQ